MSTASITSADPGAELPVLPVASVIVFEDRAQVTRAGAVPLSAHGATVTVDGVSPLIVERTIETTPPAGAVVTQVRVRRWLDASTLDRLAGDPALQAAHDDASDEVRRAERRLEQIEAEIDALHTVRDLTLQELALAANDAPIDLEDAGSQIAVVRTAEQRLRVARADAQAAVRAARRTFDDLDARLRAGADLGSHWRAALDIELAPAPRDADAAGAAPAAGDGDGGRGGDDGRGDAGDEGSGDDGDDGDKGGEREQPGRHDLVVRYIVPNAAWRPAHVARRAADGTTVTVHSEAVVWQATDERWPDVELTLSTARTSSATDPPPVEDDVLHLVEAGREIEIAWREVEELVGEAPTFAQLPAVDDGGEARTLRAHGRVTLEPDGLPTRVPISSFTAAATTDLVCRPERALAVHRRTRQGNEQAAPLLAGPVLLVEQGGVTGWTTTGYVAPGERFELGWGPEVALAVDRRVEAREDSTITGANETDHRVRVEVHNNGAEAQAITVIERVPVSEIDRVQVSVDEIRPPAPADADGLVSWLVTVPPAGGHVELALAYSVRRHRSVTQ